MQNYNKMPLFEHITKKANLGFFSICNGSKALAKNAKNMKKSGVNLLKSILYCVIAFWLHAVTVKYSTFEKWCNLTLSPLPLVISLVVTSIY
jgi:hypothetical protein